MSATSPQALPPGSPVARLLEQVERHHPRSLAGVREAQALAPAAFERIAGMYLGWCERALGAQALPRALAAFARFCSDVNMAQARYETDGHYAHKTYAECRAEVYDHASMVDYLWGVYLSNFLWAHHLELMLFYEQRFLTRLRQGDRIVELAPGHGGWGLWALQQTADTVLSGHDISAASAAIAGSLAQAAGLAARASYQQGDALALADEPSPEAQACICCFLVEHLEQPARLLQSMAHVLAPGGLAFFTGAITAAQVDHIYEFRHESELVALAEQAGFRVLDACSRGPARQLPRARFLPRSTALVLQKRRSTWF